MSNRITMLPLRSRKPFAQSLMTVPEMLDALGVSRDTFYKWRQTGKGPRCFALPNGELRCTVADFGEWLDGLQGAAA